MELKDSGSRQSFESGAVRDIQQGKGRFDLIPFEGLEAVAQVFEAGAVKYGERNWERGIPVSRYIDSMLRHATKAANGMLDEPHLAQAAWNALCAIATIARYPDLDDRPYMLGNRPDDREKYLQALKSSAEEMARDANETLGKIEAESGKPLVYRKYQPFNPVPLKETIPEKPLISWQEAVCIVLQGNRIEALFNGDSAGWTSAEWLHKMKEDPAVAIKWFESSADNGVKFRKQ